MPDAPIRLLLDTDVGGDVDDVFAVLLAARHPGLDLIGVTTVNGDVAQRTRIARKLLRLAGRPQVPVVTGLGPTLSGRDPGHGISSGVGFAPEGEETGSGAEGDAVSFIVGAVMASPTPLTLVAIGPLTNVGAALRQEPRLAQRLHALIFMGGRLGADAELGEYNLNTDPEATKIVLESGAPLRIGTLEVTRQATLGRTDMARLRQADVACIAAADMLERYLQQQSRDRTPMYDPLTLTLAYTPDYLTMQPVRLEGRYADRRTHLETVPDGAIAAEVSIAAAAAPFQEPLLRTIAAPWARPAGRGVGERQV